MDWRTIQDVRFLKCCYSKVVVLDYNWWSILQGENFLEAKRRTALVGVISFRCLRHGPQYELPEMIMSLHVRNRSLRDQLLECEAEASLTGPSLDLRRDMNAMDPLPAIHRTPVEIVTRMFGFLDASSLLGLAQVCGRWRSIAFDHPDYWGVIVISDVKLGTLSRSWHRLNQGGSRALALLKIDYTQKHDHDDPVLKHLVPMLNAAVPRARVIVIKIESMYRLHIEGALCHAAPHLRRLSLFYASEPLPDLHPHMPLGYRKKLLSNTTGNLRAVHLYHILLPSIVIGAFEKVDEVFWIHAFSSKHDEFPTYLFEHFPNVTRLRITCGACFFTNSPLPRDIYNRFARLAWVDLEISPSYLAQFFKHLPLHDLDDLTIGCPDEDGVYLTLEPLQSWFDLILTQMSPTEFMITVKSRHTHRVRRFAEPFRYYYEGSIYTNALLENADFAEQLASFHIHLSLWSRLKPWLLSSMDLVPKLILEVNDDTPLNVRFPTESITFCGLETLVIQAKYDFVYVDPNDLVAFADRLETKRIALELRRVFINGPRSVLTARFTSVEFSWERYLGNMVAPVASK